LIISAGASRARADSALYLPELTFDSWEQPCNGTCSVHVFSGQAVRTSLRSALGLNGFTSPSDYNFDDSYLIGFGVSRRIATFGDNLAIEGEVGIAQRFGDMEATEIWSALYLRWLSFPWNNYIKTSFAVSTGLNYATKLDELELARSTNGRGSKFLHYFSPEITFALPETPNQELVFRLHHRSGGKILLDHGLFNGVDGGAHHITAGIRFKY